MLKSAHVFFKTPKLLTIQRNAVRLLSMFYAPPYVKTVLSHTYYVARNNFSEYIPALLKFCSSFFKNIYFLMITILKMIVGRKYISN